MLSFDTHDADAAMRQAHMTAEHYALEAHKTLSLIGGNDWSPEAKATFIGHFMQAAAMDLLGASALSAGQHIAQAIREAVEQ
jgi:hypothetical protein